MNREINDKECDLPTGRQAQQKMIRITKAGYKKLNPLFLPDLFKKDYEHSS